MEISHGGKKYKDGPTVLLCCSVERSEQLQPLLVGKLEKPWCMQNIWTCPSKYETSQNAWVTVKTFFQ
jgi:hypothetical protein